MRRKGNFRNYKNNEQKEKKTRTFKKSENCYGGRENWWVCDFETVTSNTDYYEVNNDTRVLLANSCNYLTGQHYTFTTIDEWFNFHLSKDSSQTFFFHNLSFDGVFLRCFLSKNGYEIINEEELKNNQYEMFASGYKIFSIRFKHRGKTGTKGVKNWIFRCSLKLLSSPVYVLGKSVGLAKHHEDDNKLITDKNGRVRNFYDREPKQNIEDWLTNDYDKRYFEYCRNDCEIVRLSLNIFEDCVKNLPFVKHFINRKIKQNIKNKERGYDDKDGKEDFNLFDYLTTASLTKRLMELSVIEQNDKNKTKDFYPLEISAEDYDFISNWFKGGFTQFNDDYLGEPKEVNNAIMLDVSSAYPYQMTKSLPYGEVLEEQPEGVNEVDFYTFYEINVKSAKIKDEYKHCPILLNWKKTNKEGEDCRYVRELNNFKCYYTDFEWKRICKFYDVVYSDVLVFYMKAKTYLKEYAETLYALKKYYSETEQDGLKQMIKILINAGYGILARRTKFDSAFYYDAKNEKLNKFFDMNRNDMFCVKDRLYKFYWVNDYDKAGRIKKVSCLDMNDKQKGMNKAAAAVITSRERCYLWDLVDKIGAQYFGYSDTDSILFINLPQEKFDYLIEFSKHDDVKLGDWEREYENKNIKWFGVYGAKKYYLLDENKNIIKFRFAGITESLVNPKQLLSKVDFNMGCVVIDNAVNQKIETDSGLVLIPQTKKIQQGKI